MIQNNSCQSSLNFVSKAEIHRTDERLFDIARACLKTSKKATQDILKANFLVGEVSSEFYEPHDRSRSDAVFAEKIGGRRKHVNECRRIYDRFGKLALGPTLSWMHYRTALAWNDAEKWLKLAADHGLSVSEMSRRRDDAEKLKDVEAEQDAELDLISRYARQCSFEEFKVEVYPDAIGLEETFAAGLYEAANNGNRIESRRNYFSISILRVWKEKNPDCTDAEVWEVTKSLFGDE